MTTQPPPISPEPIAVRLVKVSFKMTTRRDSAGVPRLPADFIAEQGQLVRILDVREESELVGPLGHIPSVTHVPLERIGEVSRALDPETCIVIVSARGGRAGVAACLLEELGMKRVAAMEGGMAAWKQLGFTALRDRASYRTVLTAIAPGIGRDGRPLVTLEPGAHLTTAQITAHVGDPTSVRWVKLGAFLLHGKRSCVDGRDDNGVIGTPGGDAGEILLALAAVEQVASKALSPAEVEQVLIDHIDTFGRFYMHTDMLAMNRLIVDGYRTDGRIAPYVKHLDSSEDWRQWMMAPPEPLRAAILEHLVGPEVMGCGHLRFAMTAPEYRVRPGLTRAFLEAFHRLRWAGSPELQWVVLGGDHSEGAVASITVAGGLHSYTRVPLVTPSVAGAQIFVSHPQVTNFLRREMAAFLCEAGVASDEDGLIAAIDELGTVQATQTLARLAPGLPLFDIHFALDGTPAVTPRGAIRA